MDLIKTFKNKKVLVTGHTGFKGFWLSLWLKKLGSQVYGISLNKHNNVSKNILRHYETLNNYYFDISSIKRTKNLITRIKPDYVFHLAAQAIVVNSFKDPHNTWLTNVIGTQSVLESVNLLKNKCNCVFITSDKCYENLEWIWGYKEDDRLGGSDPYSSSKAACELLIKSYYKSFFKKKDNNIRIASARAGNVIGGNDWSKYRLIPDIVRSWSKNKIVNIRNPKSTRPWQHVLEAVGAYLYLGYLLNVNSKIDGEAFNFGPSYKKNYSTKEVLNNLVKYWPLKAKIKILKKKQFVESNLLKLNCTKAKKIGWKSILSLQETLFLTSTWYKTFYFEKKNIDDFSKGQIEKYFEKYKLKIKKI